MATKTVKRINLALQGGGSHGAFTWGVLDRLLEEECLVINAISGTSAGAMNAVVLADGMAEGGREGARKQLRQFWRAVSDEAMNSPIKRSPYDALLGNWSLDHSPGYIFFDMMTRYFSPADLNPLKLNPLHDILVRFVNFEQVRAYKDLQLFIAATNVETGRVRVFNRDELGADEVMASACLPFMFEAVEIDGVPYWDGGYAGNPPLFPFASRTRCDDIVIVQINPIVRKGTPRSAAEIHNRVNEITFNQSLLKELRNIEFIQRMLRENHLDSNRYRTLHIHIIENQAELNPLGASSKLNAEWEFMIHLRDVGRQTAEQWLENNFADIGERSSVNLRTMFQGE